MVSLDDWKKWWEKDGFKLVQLKEKEKEQELWVLYSINVPYDSSYGRHMGALIVLDKHTREIIAHDVTNEWVHGNPDGPDVRPAAEIYDWFDRHVKEGLTNVS